MVDQVDHLDRKLLFRCSRNRNNFVQIFALLPFVAILIAIIGCTRSLAPAGSTTPSATSTSVGTPGLTSDVMEQIWMLSTQTAMAQQGTSQPQPTPFSPRTPQATAIPPTPSIDNLLEQEINNLHEGRRVFNPPLQMVQGEKERIEYRILPISPGVNEGEVQATLVTGLQGHGTPQIEPIKVGTFMKATLIGDDGLVITPLSDEEQFVTADKFTQWAWDVIAIKPGDRQLNLKVAVIVNLNGKEKSRDIPVETKTVHVNVNVTYEASGFIGKYWQFVVTVLTLPLIGWLWKQYSSRRAKKADKEEISKKKHVPFE